MRAALAIAVALLAAATPAAASQTIGRSALTAGPVLAGGSVLWADAPSGRPRVSSGGTGRDPVVLERWPRATTKDTGRTVAALAGSATSVAAVVETCTFTIESDFGFLGCAERAFGGPAGRFAPFGWPLPPRGLRRCPGPRAPVSVAAGENVIAVAYTPTCQGIAQAARAAAAARSRIVVRRGGTRRAIPSIGATQVRIAGRYLAYLEGVRTPERAVLYDLTRRERVRRVDGRDLTAIDVQRDGALALVRTAGSRSCVSIVRRRERRLACRVADPGDVAIAGGRVLFARGTPRGARLVLIGPGGRRVLERAARPRAIGGFDLAADRAVWSAGEPSGFQRIHLERL